MSQFLTTTVRSESPAPTLELLIDRLRRLLVRDGYFQHESAAGRLQPEWELFSTSPNLQDASGWRVKYRYARAELCGIEVYDLSDVRTASWRKPLADPRDWSGRDFGIWGGGRCVLDAALADLVPKPTLAARGPTHPPDRYAWLVGLLTGEVVDDGDQLAEIALAVNRLWAEMSAADRDTARRRVGKKV